MTSYLTRDQDNIGIRVLCLLQINYSRNKENDQQKIEENTIFLCKENEIGYNNLR